MSDQFYVNCPYCGEEVEIYLEPDVMGTLVQDCEVCCRPWRVDVSRDREYRYVEVTRGDGSFRGEDEREMGFRSTMRRRCPSRRQVDLVNADGRDDDLRRLVRDALAVQPDVVAVYSMYAFGGNRATVEAFADAGRCYRVFVAHDLHEHNLALLHDGHLSAVLHHDLRQDMLHACQLIMQAHDALPGRPRSWHSAIQVVTPYNLPLSST